MVILSRNVIWKYLIVLTFALVFVFSNNSVTAHAEGERVLTGIEAVSEVKEVAYGSTFDKSEIQVTALYSDETKENVTPESVSDLDTTKVGVQTVTVTYQGFEATVEITVLPKPVTGIEAVSDVKEVVYGSTFDSSGIRVTATYVDNTKEQVTPESISAVDTSKVGVQTVTVTYQGFEATVEITVLPRKVTGIVFAGSTKSSMKISWAALEESERYVIYTSSSVSKGFKEYGTATKAEYTFTGLKQGEVIYAKIRAASGEWLGEYSDAAPIAAKPDQVTGVTATRNVKTKITLQWNAATGATGYAVYYRLSTDTTYQLAGYSTKTSYKVTGLKAGKDYYFIVYAYAALEENVGDGSDAVLYGTAPALPVISKLKGGDKRLKVYWTKGTGATSFLIYVSTQSTTGFTLKGTITGRSYNIATADGLKNNVKYYIKVVAVRTVSGITMESESVVSSATTKKAKATSTKAKHYKTKKKFKKSPAYKNYKAFRKKLVYKKSYVVPGQITTNVAGFNSAKMVPQGITFAGKYLLISAYDYSKTQESVIYVMDKSTGKYRTTIVMPHMGHMGGIAYDGTNLWIAYGKNLQCLPYKVIKDAVSSGAAYTEIYEFKAVVAMPDQASYLTYYKNRIWVGTYSETASKYMYGFTIQNKTGTPTLTKTNRILMPNRTQGVVFTSSGKMIVSRSCQSNKTKSGFISRLETYKPTWNFSKLTIKKNKKKKVVKLPPMNEGVAINGSYTYVLYESAFFPDCEAPLDRITAFKTSKIS